MLRRLREEFWPTLDHLAGWMMLLAGSAMMATGVLSPAWRTTVELSRHRDLMKDQTDVIVDQEEAYVRFHAALMDRDPVLVRRLACDQLRLKPTGAATLTLAAATPTERDGLPGLGPVFRDGGVGAWLHRPADAVPAPPPTRSALDALTLGPARIGLIGCGVVCVTIGLLLPLGPPSSRAAADNA